MSPNNIMMGAISDAVKDTVVRDVERFNEIFNSLNADINFKDYFNIPDESLAVFKKVANENLKSDLLEGIQFAMKLDGSNQNSQPSETLFFYPIAGVIQRAMRAL